MQERIYKTTSLLASLAAGCALFMLSLPADAKIEVEITGIEDEIRRNVLIFLSLQRYRDSSDLTQDMVDRLYERSAREVRQALRPFGFYSPKIEGSLQRAHKENRRNGEEASDWQVTLHIEPGPAVIVREVDVRIVGPGEERRSLQRIVRESTLKEGERLNHGAYDKLKGDLQRTAVSIGYLDAKLEHSELNVDLEKLTATAAIELHTGLRYKFGPTQIEQDAVDPQLARRFLRYKEGDNFRASALLRTQFALDDSLYFSDVEIVPGTRSAENLSVPISIRAGTARKDIYSIGLGYATNTGGRGTLGWDNRRVNTAGHRAHVKITLADLERSLETRYLIPVGDPALERLSLDGAARRETLADLDVRSLEFKPGLTQVRGRWQRVLSTSISRETTESVGSARSTDLLLIPGISFARIPRNYSGDTLSLTPGLYAELTGSHGTFGSDADFLRLNVRDEHVFDFAPGWHLLLRGELGLSAVAGFSELPGSQRFFAGGDRSVRGFDYNELSPTEQAVDRAGNPVLIKTGGRHLLVGSIEVVRDLPRNFGIALFTDGGNAVNKLGDRLEYSVGVGLRWRLPVITVGIDVAQALSRSDIGPHIHLNISPQL